MPLRYGNALQLGADPAGGAPGGADSSSILQAEIDRLYNSYGGGIIEFDPGNYSASLIVKGGVRLIGAGRGCTMITAEAQGLDRSVLQFDATCNYASAEHIFLVAKQNPNSQINAVTVAVNRPVMLKDCNIWGGQSGLYTAGIDGTIEDCFIMGCKQSGVISNGANWYKRCKIDNNAWHTQSAFYQGQAHPQGPGGVMENHFDQCDFSGNYDHSVFINDNGENSAISVFTGGVFSNQISVINGRATLFAAAEIGNFNLGPNPGKISVTGSWAATPITIPAQIAKAGNCNIS